MPTSTMSGASETKSARACDGSPTSWCPRTHRDHGDARTDGSALADDRERAGDQTPRSGASAMTSLELLKEILP
jgi:hypothetical protein